jgi:aryl-alcohol dehydrogenase-like predicted oxidoreductase
MSTAHAPTHNPPANRSGAPANAAGQTTVPGAGDVRQLGRSGLRVSLVGLGTNNFGTRLDRAASARVIDAAIEAGITLFDTADVYGNRGGSETILGEVLGARRGRIVLATKFATPLDDAGILRGASRRYIIQALEASLRRLKTEWIDLYQLHRPDPSTPIDETLRALDDAIRAGKVRYIGASNLPAWQVVQAQHVARELGLERFISSQDEYSLLRRDAERELIPALSAYGIGLLPYFPLANGLLTGKYRVGEAAPAGSRLAGNTGLAQRYLTARDLQAAERLSTFARELGHTPVELAFAWLAAQPTVASIIAGASTPEQVVQNRAAISWRLTPDEILEATRLACPA